MWARVLPLLRLQGSTARLNKTGLRTPAATTCRARVLAAAVGCDGKLVHTGPQRGVQQRHRQLASHGGHSYMSVHAAQALVADDVAGDPYSGPDQVSPASSHKTWDISSAVNLQMGETGPASADPLSVFSFLKKTADQHPDHPALASKEGGDQWKYWSYKEYFEQSCIVAQAFIRLGLDRFHGVCLMGFNSPQWFIANFGAIFAGGVSTGIYCNNNSESCVHIAQDCRAQILVLDTQETVNKFLERRHLLPEIKAIVQFSGSPTAPGVLSWDELLAIGAGEEGEGLDDRLRRQAPNQCCTLIYTSGTTGAPKGVMCSQDNLTWSGTQHGTALNMMHDTPYERVVSYLPLNHIAGQVMDVYISTATAATVYFAAPDALKGSLIHTLKEVQPTAFFTVPRLLEKMHEKLHSATAQKSPATRSLMTWAQWQARSYYDALNNNRKLSLYEEINYNLAKSLILEKIKTELGLNSVSNMATGSAPVSPEIIEFFFGLDLPVMNVYAMSESHSYGSIADTRAGTFRPGSAGKADEFTNIRESVLNSGNIEGEGEICFRGRNIFMGYLNSQDKTDETVSDDGWMATGDLGRIDSDGFLYVTGRVKEIIITAGGENIAPAPIEDHIKKGLPVLENAMVVGDQRKYLSILLTMKCEKDPITGTSLDALDPCVKAFLQRLGCSASTVTQVRQEITSTPRGPVAAAIQDSIDRYNRDHAITNIHEIRRWALLPRDFSSATGELNNTLKLKRSAVTAIYARLIDDLYSGGSRVPTTDVIGPS